MAQELVYTSAERGVRAGQSGFTTAAHTDGMGARLIEILETASVYTPAFSVDSPRAADNPVCFQYGKYSVGRDTHSILSRICFAGLDYTGRSNKLAHHIVPADGEKEEEGPAALIDALRTSGKWVDGWSGGPDDARPALSLPSPLPDSGGRAGTWAALAGDEGWAGVLAQRFIDSPDKPALIVFEPGKDLDLLPLMFEAIRLLPPERRWEATFSTYFTTPQRGMTCQWRCCLPDNPAVLKARRNPLAFVIDLTAPRGCPEKGPLVDAARSGVLPAADTVAAVTPLTGSETSITVERGRDEKTMGEAAAGSPPPGPAFWRPPAAKRSQMSPGAGPVPGTGDPEGPRKGKRRKVVLGAVAAMLLLLLVGSGLTACWRQFQGKAAWEAARQESRQAYEASKEARAKAGAISNRARDAVKRAAGAAHESAKKAGDALEKAREAAQEAADAVRKIVDNAVLDAPELITAKATAKATEEARAAAEEAVSAAKSAQDRAAKIQADFNEREEGRQASNAAHATREASKRAKAHVEECETARTLNKVTVASEEATKCAQEANQAAGKVETLLEILVKEAQAQAEEGKRAARRAEKARDRARTKARETKKQLVAVLEAGKYRPKPDWHCWPWYIVERCRRWAAASAKGSTMTVSLDFMSNLPDQPGAWPEIELVVGGKRKKPEEWFKATLEAYLRTPLTLSTKDGNGNQIETKRKPLPPGREFRMLGVALGLDKARMALNGFSVDRVNEGMGTVGVFKFLNDTPLFSFKLLAGDELGAPGLQMTHHEDWKREPIVGNCWLHLLKKFREEVTVISLDGRPYSMLTRGSAEKCAEGFARFSKARWRAPLNPDDLMAEFGLEEAEDLFLEWTELLPEAKPVKKGEMEWRWRAESTPSLSGKLISCIAGLQGDIKKLKEGIEKLEESIPGRCNKAGFSLNKEQLHGKSKRVKEKLEEYLRAQIGEPPEKRGKLQEHRDEHLKQAREAWKNALGSDARDDVLKTTSSKRFRNSWPYPKELWQHKKDKDDNGRKEIDEAVEKCRKQQSAYRKCLVQIKACDICRERVTRDLDFYATQCGQLAKRRAEAAKLRSRPVKLTVTFGDYFTKEVEIAPSAEDTGE